VAKTMAHADTRLSHSYCSKHHYSHTTHQRYNVKEQCPERANW
jgi:hypothetical protein